MITKARRTVTLSRHTNRSLHVVVVDIGNGKGPSSWVRRQSTQTRCPTHTYIGTDNNNNNNNNNNSFAGM